MSRGKHLQQGVPGPRLSHSQTLVSTLSTVSGDSSTQITRFSQNTRKDSGWLSLGHTSISEWIILGLPWWLSGKESASQCRRHGFDPWSGKIPRAAEQRSPQATTAEPELTARELQLLKSVNARAHALQPERPPLGEACSPKLDKSLCSSEDPAQSKINKI